MSGMRRPEELCRQIEETDAGAVDGVLEVIWRALEARWNGSGHVTLDRPAVTDRVMNKAAETARKLGWDVTELVEGTLRVEEAPYRASNELGPYPNNWFDK